MFDDVRMTSSCERVLCVVSLSSDCFVECCVCVFVMYRVCKLCGHKIFCKKSLCGCQGSMKKLEKALSVLLEHRGWTVGQRCLYHIEKYRNAKTSQERTDHKKAINRLLKIRYVE